MFHLYQHIMILGETNSFFSFPLFLSGAILIFFGSNLLIDNAKLISQSIPVVPENERAKGFIIGVTILAIGTSLPELVVSVLASIEGTSAVALGNVIGSNIANIGLVLGIIIIYKEIALIFSSYKKNLYFLMSSTAILTIYIWYNLMYSRAAGVFLIFFFVLFICYQFYALYKIPRFGEPLEKKSKTPFKIIYLFYITFGIGMLSIGAEFFLHGALGIAAILGVTAYSISLSIVALGTSLPELATSFVAIRKKEPSFVIGNIVGSNIINIVLVLGASISIAPIDLDTMIWNGPMNVYVSIVFCFILTVLLYWFCKTESKLSRSEGIMLLSIYLIFITLTFIY